VLIYCLLLLPGTHPFRGATGNVNLSKVLRGDYNELGEREYSEVLKALIYMMMDVV
jgi:hypothetical protein